eukprot:CAMPEP_0119350742 /NCGR_PEP_ID=MMETSP1333-20130426/110212_1 /TAXON_ID=418940 /ORGANISM="Scyphosphaera apsteinii, Strain RCC1455" /LENGTH=42 /DNA_ID= /DNA_START= /DNA_END= /DNA_ORIENTATION=
MQRHLRHREAASAAALSVETGLTAVVAAAFDAFVPAAAAAAA